MDDLTLQQVRELMAQNATFLARLNEHLQGMLPVYSDEYQLSTDPGESSSGVLTLPPGRDTFFKVTGFLAIVPLNTVEASLTLGNGFTIPLQNTTTLLTPIQRILRSTDLRQLDFTTGSENGGQAFLWLWGEAIPSYGKL